MSAENAPKANVASMATMKEVYTVCQNKPNAFAKGLDVMNKLWRDADSDEFVAQLTPIVQITLSNTESGEYAERLLDFTAQFLAAATSSSATATDDSDVTGGNSSLLVPMLDLALEWSSSDSKVVRERCCKLVEKTLCNLKDEYAVDDDLLDRVEAAMTSRLKDRIGAVRAAAAGALSRLQDPSNSCCKIIEAFLFHLERDPCVEVRCAIVTRMVPSTRTLAAIVARTRDVKDAVRKLALERLAEKVPIRYLSLRQRAAIIADGLNDSASAVRHVVTHKLIPAWLQQSKGSLADFLRLLDVHGSTENVQDFLEWYVAEHDLKKTATDFANACLDADKLVPEDKLTSETSLYWRCLVLHLRASESSDADALVESVFPDTVVYCAYLVKHVCALDEDWDTLRQLEHRFISQQLLTLAQAADISDNAGRARLIETVHTLLASPKVGSVLAQPLMKLLGRLFPNTEQLSQEVASVISSFSVAADPSEEKRDEMVLPPVSSIEMVKMRVKLNMLREDLSTCVEREQYAEAQEMKEKVRKLEQTLQELQTAAEASLEEGSQEEARAELDDATKLKIATLVTEMLVVTPFTSVSPFLQTCLDDIVLPGIVSTDTALRKQATHALALCCALSKRVALQHMQLLFEIALADTPQIRAIALAGVVDLVLAFGVEPFDSVIRNVLEGDEDDDDSEDEDNPPHRDASALLVDCLLRYVDDEDESLRTVAVEGMAKLQLLGRVCSPSLLSVLILHWMHPNTDPDSTFHQVLRNFMVAYSHGSPQSLRCFEMAFLPTLTAVLDASPSSPLARLNAADLLNFLVDVTLPRLPDQPGKRVPASAATEATPHDRLAVELSREVLKDPRGEDSLVFLKALTMLEVTEKASIEDLMSAARKMRSRVKAKRGAALVKKFEEKLKALACAATTGADAETQSSASVVIDSSTLSDRSCSIFGPSGSVSVNGDCGEGGVQTGSSSLFSSGRRLLDSQDLFSVSDEP
ncbi:unnamed protein product [Ixodes hexagonus]